MRALNAHAFRNSLNHFFDYSQSGFRGYIALGNACSPHGNYQLDNRTRRQQFLPDLVNLVRQDSDMLHFETGTGEFTGNRRTGEVLAHTLER